MRELPKYQCHKQVWALKIGRLEYERPTLEGVHRGGVTITPADVRYGAFFMRGDWVAKHNPEVGGYYVQYTDEYKSYSPAAAFEAGYTLIS